MGEVHRPPLDASDPAEPARVTNGRAAVAALTYLGFTLQLLQAGIVPLLPAMGRQLHVTIGAASWLLTSGLLSGAVALAVITRLADLFGKRPMILLSLLLVLAGCVLGSFTDNFGLLIVARVLMGAQMPMLALPEAIASDTMPPRRANFAIGSIHAGTGIGIAGGILLGALVGLHPTAWHVFFYVGAITTLIGVVSTATLVRDSTYRAIGGLDVSGATLLALGLVGVLLGLSQGPEWGWDSPVVIGLLVVGVALLAAWLRQAATARHPLIRLSDILRPRVRVPYAMTFFLAFGVYGSLSAVTRLAQTPPASGYGLGYRVADTALFAIPQAVGAVVGIAVLRLVARTRGHVAATGVGVLFNTLAFVGFALLHFSSNGLLASQAVYSMGTAIGLAGIQIIVLGAVAPSESGIALGISIVAYAVGNSLGSDVAGTLLSAGQRANGLPTLGSYLSVFWVCGACSLVAFILCLTLARSAASRRVAA